MAWLLTLNEPCVGGLDNPPFGKPAFNNLLTAPPRKPPYNELPGKFVCLSLRKLKLVLLIFGLLARI